MIDEEKSVESSIAQSGHKNSCLDTAFFKKLSCLEHLEAPKNLFDIMKGSLVALSHILSERCWYQLFYSDTEESKAYDGIGTFHELLGLDQKECLDVLVASGLVAPNKNHRMEAKTRIFGRMQSMVDGFDFKINTQCEKRRLSFVLIGPPKGEEK